MKAMILAAGRGNRLRPITDHTPKPLIKVGGKPIIEYHLEKLSKIGIRDIVINISHLADLIESTLGDGSQYGVRIQYSREMITPLETGGGIYQALPLLGADPFMVINGDIFTDYPFQQLPKNLDGLAHIVLVDNPPHNLKGDFSVIKESDIKYVSKEGSNKLTFSGISILHPNLFRDCKPGIFSITPLLIQAMANKLVTGEHYFGRFVDIGGKPENLEALQREFNQKETQK
jgi:N-acetyl-alpha-D-muramate 1-phosphate uridylyltransferase